MLMKSMPRSAVTPFPFRRPLAVALLVMALLVLPPRRAGAETSLDTKAMYYVEGGDRMSVFAPTTALRRELESGLTVRIEGIYNAISGATPTGAPPRSSPRVTAVTPVAPGNTVSVTPARSREEEGDDEHDSDSVGRALGGGSQRRFSALSAATPATPAPYTPPAPASSAPPAGGTATPATPTVANDNTEVPTAESSDTRVGLNLSLSQRLESHTPALMLSYSSENDYTSVGASLQDAVDYNKKNTTLTYGGAYAHDTIEPANGQPKGSRNTVDGMVGLTQVLTPTTLFTVNFAGGVSEGLLTDSYKVVELNGALVPEKRPDHRTRTILYLALNQSVTPLNGSAELSARHYSDDFGIQAETLGLAWFQKLGERFVLSPRIRYHDQAEADFYAVTFSGSPEFYSADYRLSALRAVSYGLKAVWTPNTRCAFDLEYELYDQEGTDGVTSQAVYPRANIVIAGVRLWL